MPSTAATQVLSLVTTVGGEDDARALAASLLDQRLAACVQVERIESHFRWEGALRVEAEWRLTIKSTPDKLAALQASLAASHPYDLPQVVWQVLDATPAYEGWVRGEIGGVSAP